MTIEYLRDLVSDPSRKITEEEINEALKFFMKDSEGANEYVREFVGIYFKTSNSDSAYSINDWHLCNQKYIASIAGKPELKREHLPYLYLKEVEYYTFVNSYSECIRCINKILDIEVVPDFCLGAALSQAVAIFMTCGLTGVAENYVEKLRVFANVCDFVDKHLIMLDCNLMQAFAIMGKRKEYEFHRKNLTRYCPDDIEEDVLSITELYKLGSEAIIDKDVEPSDEYIEKFLKLMDGGCFVSSLSAGYAEVVVPILRRVKGRIADEKLIDYTLKMIDFSTNIADKLDMYEVLIEEFKPSSGKYSYVFDDYNKTLVKYYKNSRETHKHEVMGELISYEIEKQYRRKALTDELTGIGNRSAFESGMDEIKGECNGEQVPSNLTIFAMDVNGLKGVNDNFGHSAGDDYIKGAADCITRAMGSYGHIYRVGGDEFSSLIRAVNFPAENVARILRDYLSNWTDSYGNTLSMAIGYASSFDHPELALDELKHLADVEMYKDKSLYYKQIGKDRRKR